LLSPIHQNNRLEKGSGGEEKKKGEQTTPQRNRSYRHKEEEILCVSVEPDFMEKLVSYTGEFFG